MSQHPYRQFVSKVSHETNLSGPDLIREAARQWGIIEGGKKKKPKSKSYKPSTPRANEKLNRQARARSCKDAKASQAESTRARHMLEEAKKNMKMAESDVALAESRVVEASEKAAGDKKFCDYLKRSPSNPLPQN